MAKVLTLLRRDPSASAAAAESHWLGYLEWLIAAQGKAAGLFRVVHNEALPVEVRAMPGNELVGWTGVTETWFDTTAQANMAMAKLSADHANKMHAGFIDIISHLPVDERLLNESGVRPLPVKMMVFFKRRPDVSRKFAQDYWQGPHVELGMVKYNAKDFLKRYFQNHVLLDYVNPDAAYDYDGSPEFWLEDASVLTNVSADSEVMKAIAADEHNFANVKSIETLNVSEREVFARDAAAAGWIAA